MNIVVVGLGLIGGSYGKAIKKYTKHRVVGIDTNISYMSQAVTEGAIDDVAEIKDFKNADLIILALYPDACVEFAEKYGRFFKKDCIVTDCCGIKEHIFPKLLKNSREMGYIYIGSHLMAGKEKSGFAASSADLFKGASFLIVPGNAQKSATERLAKFACKIGFDTVKATTFEEHDRMIAYTSQLPHVLACAYVLSPSTPNHNGFSAGSYRDVSRVANINAELWSELFLENRAPLLEEINILEENIDNIKKAIENNDKENLTKLLAKSRAVKEALGE